LVIEATILALDDTMDPKYYYGYPKHVNEIDMQKDYK